MSDDFPTYASDIIVPEPIPEYVAIVPEPEPITPVPDRPDLPDKVPDFVQELRDDQEAVGRDNVEIENKKRRWRGLDRLPERDVE